MAGLAGKTLFITGASRGIGLAIALRAARDGANIAIAAKTAEPHPKLTGTIFTAAKEIEAAGGVVIAAASLVDRSAGEADLGVPFHPLITLNFPTYAPEDVPEDLATTPAIKPGSRAVAA